MGRERWADLLAHFEARPKPESMDTLPIGAHRARVGDQAEEMLPPGSAAQDENGLESLGA